MMENLYPEGTSIKLVVHPQLANNDKDPAQSISFTCNGKLQESVLIFLRLRYIIFKFLCFSELQHRTRYFECRLFLRG